MIYYITDSNDNVVAQFDGIDVESKDGHTKHNVDDATNLPGVDKWDDDYL